MTDSGKVRALGAEVSEHARALREDLERHARPVLEQLVADVLHATIRNLQVDPATLPPDFVRLVAGAVARRFTLADSVEARRAVLAGLWAAVKSRAVHLPSSPALPAQTLPAFPAPPRKDPADGR